MPQEAKLAPLDNASPGGTPTQGALSSEGLMKMVREAVRKIAPGLEVQHADKSSLLLALFEALGPAALVDVGLAFRELNSHPVLNALLLGDSPHEVMHRWGRLERFGHTRHRTLVLDEEDDGQRVLTLEHVALDGGAIHFVNDLFMWGLLLALLGRAGFQGLEGNLKQEDGGTIPLYARSQVVLEHVPAETARLEISWAPERTHRLPFHEQDADDTGAMTARLETVLASDLLRGWRVGDAAGRLAVSTRDLQRCLKEEGTSFSETLHQARLNASMSLLSDRTLSLSEITFCTGFSDQAHFSRLFRRYYDVPPSAFRALLFADQNEGVDGAS